MYIYLLVYLSLAGFGINYYRFLNSLLMLEFLFMSMLLGMLVNFFGVHYMLFLLIIGVCEGIIGLLLAFMIMRFYGGDMYTLVDYSL